MLASSHPDLGSMLQMERWFYLFLPSSRVSAEYYYNETLIVILATLISLTMLDVQNTHCLILQLEGVYRGISTHCGTFLQILGCEKMQKT